MRLAGRPVLVDGKGPFGNPTADSARTAVRAGTRALWMVVFAPPGFALERLAQNLEHAGRSMRRHLGDETMRYATGVSVKDPAC